MSAEEKTPVQVLQEFCQKEAKTPQYALVQAEGKDHFPMFFYDLTVGDVTISGIQGLSKKKAKHAAAEAMLAKLGVVTPSKEGMTVSKIKAAKIPQRNAVGELQQLCTLKEWPAPKYTVTSIEGPSHAPVFTMECTIETLHAAVSGTGRCKKEAKQLVAAQMLQSLAGNPHIQQLTSEAEEPSPVYELQGAAGLSGSRGVFVEERNVAAGRGHVWESHPSACICNRPVQTIKCTQCGNVTKGHVSKACPRHRGVIHLMDMKCCNKCGAGKENLQEFPAGVQKED